MSDSRVRDSLSLWRSFRQMLALAGSERPALQRSLMFSAIAALIEGLMLLALFPVIDRAIHHGELAPFYTLLAVFVVHFWCYWRSQEFQYGQSFASLVHELHQSLSEHLRKIPLSRIEQYRDGELAHALAASVDHIATPMGTFSQALIRLIVLPSVVFVGLLWIEWRLALLLLLVVVALWPLHKLREAAVERGVARLAEAQVACNAAMLSYCQGLAVLRAANATSRASSHLMQQIDELCRLQESGEKRGWWRNISYSLVAELGVWVLLSVAAVLALQAQWSLVYLPVFALVLLRLLEPLGLFAFMTPIFSLMRAGAQRMTAVMDIEPLPVKPDQHAAKDGSVSLEQLAFTYPEQSEPVIQGLRLHCPDSTVTALVGPSGSGKSTLFRLLTRYADPDQGCLTIGGRDIRSFTQEDLMKQIAVVFQDVYLFDDSIFNNIAMARPDASQEEIEAAARAAHCHDFISRLPRGYDTPIGELGGKLSGGERQRISIARALLKDAPIVLLDEPTAALDSESERMVQKAVSALAQGRTVLMIAHRLSTVVAADQIVVLEQGRIVEQGTHGQLLNQEGLYHRLWHAQQRVKEWHLAATEGALI